MVVQGLNVCFKGRRETKFAAGGNWNKGKTRSSLLTFMQNTLGAEMVGEGWYDNAKKERKIELKFPIFFICGRRKVSSPSLLSVNRCSVFEGIAKTAYSFAVFEASGS